VTFFVKDQENWFSSNNEYSLSLSSGRLQVFTSVVQELKISKFSPPLEDGLNEENHNCLRTLDDSSKYKSISFVVPKFLFTSKEFHPTLIFKKKPIFGMINWNSIASLFHKFELIIDSFENHVDARIKVLPRARYTWKKTKEGIMTACKNVAKRCHAGYSRGLEAVKKGSANMKASVCEKTHKFRSFCKGKKSSNESEEKTRCEENSEWISESKLPINQCDKSTDLNQISSNSAVPPEDPEDIEKSDLPEVFYDAFESFEELDAKHSNVYDRMRKCTSGLFDSVKKYCVQGTIETV
jgi:hypothetical protein